MNKSKLLVMLIIILFSARIYPDNQSQSKYYFYQSYFLNLDTLKKIPLKGKPTLIGQNSDYFVLDNGIGASIVRKVQVLSKKNLKIETTLPARESYKKIHFSGNYILIPVYFSLWAYDLRGKMQFLTVGLSNPVVYKNRLFGLLPSKIEGNVLLFSVRINNKKPENFINPNLTSKDYPKGEHELIRDKTGVIHIIRSGSENMLIIRKYNESAKLIYETKTPHTLVKITGIEHHTTSYLHRLTETENYLIYTSYNRRIPVTRLIHRATGEIRELPFIIAGVVRDNTDHLRGLFVLNEKSKVLTLYNPLGQKQWSIPFPDSFSGRVKGHLRGDQLIVTRYGQISSGSQLMSLQWKTGKRLWQADVKQLMVEHSKYLNDVNLSVYKSKVILHGEEAGGHYLQVFDAMSGKRLYADMKKTW